MDGHDLQVQGVSWDPLGTYLTSFGNDATLRFFSQGKAKKSTYHCAHVITHLDNQNKEKGKLFLGVL